MRCKLNDRYLVQCRWQHVWCDPKFFGNLTFNEYIPGPFKSPKLVCTLPFFTCPKRDFCCSFGTKEGAEASKIHFNDLNCNFSPYNCLSRSYDSMNREDVVCGHGIKKNDSYLGPGIPDPWKYFPYIDGLPVPYFGDLKTDIKRHLAELFHCKNFRSGKDNSCFCCKKRYLFECPDNSGANLRDRNICSCLDCHGKDNITSEESAANCKCVQVLQNWVLENSHLLNGKDRQDNSRKQGQNSLTGSSRLSSEEEEATVRHVDGRKKLSMVCTCFKNQVRSTNVPVHCHQSNTRLSSCPYFKIYTPKKADAETNTEKFTQETYRVNETISREIQTESLHSESKKENENIRRTIYCKPKCQCSSKCSYCSLLKCKCPEVGFRPQNLAGPNLCSANSSFVCPFSTLGYICKKNSLEPDSSKNKDKKKKKKSKDKTSEIELNSEEPSYLWSKQYQDSPIKTETKSSKKKENPKLDSLDSNEKVYYYYMPTNSTFDRLKFLTNCRLENSLLKKEAAGDLMNTRFCNIHSRHSIPEFRDLYNGDTLNIGPKERLKSSHCYKKPGPKENQLESSCENYKYSRNHEFGLSCSRRFKTVQTSTTSMNERSKIKKEVPTKIKFLKEFMDSDESITYGLNRNCEGSCKEIRKRRRLSKSRRKKKKLSVRKPSILNKPLKNPDRAHKNIQVNEMYVADRNQSFQNSKRVSFAVLEKKETDPKLFIGKELNPSRYLVSRQFSFSKYSPSITDTIRRVEREISQRKLYAGMAVNKDLRQQTDFDGVFDKISYNSGTTWSTNTLKNIVDDLLGDKQTLTAIKLKGQEVQTNTENKKTLDCHL